jgi:hypothetical protein
MTKVLPLVGTENLSEVLQKYIKKQELEGAETRVDTLKRGMVTLGLVQKLFWLRE